MELRPYQAADRAACLAIFDSNPGCFAPHERREFEDWLDHIEGEYFVLPHEGEVLACGGFALSEDRARANLTWGMVHHAWQGKGLGRYLTLYRLREISKRGPVVLVGLDTSQHTQGFYEKLGFKPVSFEANGYAPGLDRVDMRLKLTVCP
jgi:ribosomal protein S18 acetylase RimI-like enzyme